MFNPFRRKKVVEEPKAQRVASPGRRVTVAPSPAPTHSLPYMVNIQIGRDVKHGEKVHESLVESVVVGVRDDEGLDRSACWRIHQGELDAAPKFDVAALAARIGDAKTLLDVVDAFTDALVEESSRG